MGTDQYNTLEHFGNVDNALALTNLATKLLVEDETIGLITHPGDLSYVVVAVRGVVSHLLPRFMLTRA